MNMFCGMTALGSSICSDIIISATLTRHEVQHLHSDKLVLLIMMTFLVEVRRQ